MPAPRQARAWEPRPLSDLTTKMRPMASYSIAALIRRFDTGADSAITGILSSFLGEVILLEAGANGWRLRGTR